MNDRILGAISPGTRLLGALLLSTLLLSTLLVGSCSAGQKREEPAPAFFELAAYMENEMEVLQRKQDRVFKSISFNGKTEEQRPEKLNYEQELALFVQADINRPAWRDKYSIDSTFSGSVLESLQYEALDDKLSTRHIRIDFQQEQVSRVVVREKISSVLADSDRELIYLPGEGYQINSTQTGQAGDNVVALQVKWMKD